MKQTTMLSQITTQEDVLVAGITMKQLVIWFIGGLGIAAIYILLPETMKLNAYKVVPMLVIGSTTALSTVKHKGSMLLDIWLLKAQYTLRPKITTE